MPRMPHCLLAVAATATLLIGGPALAAGNAGPEPYKAADPQYAKPMTQEPLIAKPAAESISLGSADEIKGPAAGPEPYSAPTPQYSPMTSEPKFQTKKEAPPKL